MTTRYPVATALMVAALAGVAGCAASAGDQPATPSAGGGAASEASTATPQPSPPPASPSACASADRVTVQTGTSPQAICLPVGRKLQLDAPASPHQPWQPFTSSNPDVLACTSAPTNDGGATATCRALRPGTASITTTPAPFAGDPHGPPQYTWQLTVTVTA